MSDPDTGSTPRSAADIIRELRQQRTAATDALQATRASPPGSDEENLHLARWIEIAKTVLNESAPSGLPILKEALTGAKPGSAIQQAVGRFYAGELVSDEATYFIRESTDASLLKAAEVSCGPATASPSRQETARPVITGEARPRRSTSAPNLSGSV